MDREKVKKGLDICTSKEPCNGCPYLKERNCSLAMVADALALLKEQEEQDGKIKTLDDKNAKLMLLINEYLKKEREEAVEPKVEKAILDYQSWHYICGDCGGQIDINDNYCRHCGRVVAHICNYNERKDGEVNGKLHDVSKGLA